MFITRQMFSMKEFGIASNLKFISRTNFMLSVEHEKCFITSGPGIIMVLICYTFSTAALHVFSEPIF